jgi:hypothetical protein
VLSNSILGQLDSGGFAAPGLSGNLIGNTTQWLTGGDPNLFDSYIPKAGFEAYGASDLIALVQANLAAAGL